jgi:hypothetical protein
MKKLYLLSHLLLVAAILSACSDSSPVAPKTDNSRTVEGIDFDTLFEKHSKAEINAVLNEWAARDVSDKVTRDFQLDVLMGACRAHCALSLIPWMG